MYDVCEPSDPVTALTADQADSLICCLVPCQRNPKRRDNIAQKLSQASPIAVLASPEKDVPDVRG